MGRCVSRGLIVLGFVIVCVGSGCGCWRVLELCWGCWFGGLVGYFLGVDLVLSAQVGWVLGLEVLLNGLLV